MFSKDANGQFLCKVKVNDQYLLRSRQEWAMFNEKSMQIGNIY